MQPITPDFVYAQLRIAAVAIVAYCGGAGYFSPAGVTLASALIISVLPLVVPWAFSVYANFGMVKVPVNSQAAAVDRVTKAKAAEGASDV